MLTLFITEQSQHPRGPLPILAFKYFECWRTDTSRIASEVGPILESTSFRKNRSSVLSAQVIGKLPFDIECQ